VRSTKHLAHPPKQSIAKSAQAECLCYFFRNLFSLWFLNLLEAKRPRAQLAMEKVIYFVISSEARNLSWIYGQLKQGRFVGAQRPSERRQREIFRSPLSRAADDGPRFALHHHRAREVIIKHRVPRRTRMRIGKHQDPFLVHLRANLGPLDPHGHANHILGRRSRGGKNRPQIRKHVRALRRGVLRNFARALVRARYAACRDNISDARYRWNRIRVPQSFDVERFSFAHGGEIFSFREFGRRPSWSAKESILEIRITGDKRAIITSKIKPMQPRSLFKWILKFSFFCRLRFTLPRYIARHIHFIIVVREK
jgi:hypothetical protein